MIGISKLLVPVDVKSLMEYNRDPRLERVRLVELRIVLGYVV